MYQTTPSVAWANTSFGNPVLILAGVTDVKKQLACPAQYSPITMGVVSVLKDSIADNAPAAMATQVVCLRDGTNQAVGFLASDKPAVGGVYQVASSSEDYKGRLNKNAFTGASQCPVDYCPVLVGRTQHQPAARHQMSAAQYMCMRDAKCSIDVKKMPPPPFFGGMFQMDDCSSHYSIVNPYTKAVNCPAGFVWTQIARLFNPLSGCNADHFMCTRQGTTDPQSWFGGAYSKVKGSNPKGFSFQNPLANFQFGCPAGFQSVPTGSIRAIEDGNLNKLVVERFMCFKATADAEPFLASDRPSLGGVFSQPASSSVSSPAYVKNAIADAAMGCPKGYCRTIVGRVLSAPIEDRATLMMCVNDEFICGKAK